MTHQILERTAGRSKQVHFFLYLLGRLDCERLPWQPAFIAEKVRRNRHSSSNQYHIVLCALSRNKPVQRRMDTHDTNQHPSFKIASDNMSTKSRNRIFDTCFKLSSKSFAFIAFHEFHLSSIVYAPGRKNIRKHLNLLCKTFLKTLGFILDLFHRSKQRLFWIC